MKESKVYFLPMEKFSDVPSCIEKASGEFFSKGQFVAIKLHFGEKGNKGYINPKWIKPIAQMVKKKGAFPYLTDTNTIYRGQRSDSVHHLMIAYGHGFRIEKAGAPVIISDGIRGNEYIEVEVGGKHYNNVKIARGIKEAHAMIVLSHTKGHVLVGFGGAIKNLGMGCASKGAKYEMHAAMVPKLIKEKCVACGECIKWCSGHALTLVGGKIALDEEKCVGCGECVLACQAGAIEIPWDESPVVVQERFVEHAVGAVKDKLVCYVNYMHFISKHCDCWSSDKQGAILDNLGILVSDDPVAIDQASLDIINKNAGKDLFSELHKGIDYTAQLSYAEKIGLGTRNYRMIKAVL